MEKICGKDTIYVDLGSFTQFGVPKYSLVFLNLRTFMYGFIQNDLLSPK